MDAQGDEGLLLVPGFVGPAERVAVLDWLGGLEPLWEQRFSTVRPPPPGEAQRPLLRPVYWLGNWQFACLDYYHPPLGVKDRCVAAEPFPPVLQAWVDRVADLVRARLPAAMVPRGWVLNTCLVNFYGDKTVDGRRVDTARVGDHRDFEPGPVASVSLGERAFFQFVDKRGQALRNCWLEDGALQVFAGPRWKDRAFHRVPRVERRGTPALPPEIAGFTTRRVNFTFRFVPPGAIVPFAALGAQAQADVRGYVEILARRAPFWAAALAAAGPPVSPSGMSRTDDPPTG